MSESNTEVAVCQSIGSTGKGRDLALEEGQEARPFELFKPLVFLNQFLPACVDTASTVP